MKVDLFDYAFCYNKKTVQGAIRNLSRVPYFFRMVKQRVKNGFCSVDVWSLGDFIIAILPPALRFLNENRCGYPHTMSDKEWGETLEKIASLFERGSKESSDINPFPLYTQEWRDAQLKLETERKDALKQGFSMLANIIDSLWD